MVVTLLSALALTGGPYVPWTPDAATCAGVAYVDSTTPEGISAWPDHKLHPIACAIRGLRFTHWG